MAKKNQESKKLDWGKIVFILLVFILIVLFVGDFIIHSKIVTDNVCSEILEEKEEIQKQYDNCNKEIMTLRIFLNETIEFMGDGCLTLLS